MTTGATSISDAIRYAILYQLSNIHTALPGQIVSYDFTTQKASIQPTINKVWSDGTKIPLPILENVPVIFPESGGASITFPVLPGDTCLIIFAERSIDEWKTNGGLVNPVDPRKFDFTDAVAIMGLKPFNASFPPRTNNTDLVINFAGSSISITPTGAIKINTASTLALGTPTVELINQLITVITSIEAAMTRLFTDGDGIPETGAAATACQTFVLNLTSIDGTLP